MPRLKIVIRAAEMQSLIVQGLERLVHTSSQLREEAANAEVHRSAVFNLSLRSRGSWRLTTFFGTDLSCYDCFLICPQPLAPCVKAALKEQTGLTDASYSQLEHVHHHKPWWICHETYWHKFHADPDDPVTTETAQDRTTTTPPKASLVPALKPRDTLTRKRSMRGMGVGSGR